MTPMISVLRKPETQPAWWNALGIAKMPVPREPFSRWTSVSLFLYRKNKTSEIIDYYRKLWQAVCWSATVNLRGGMRYITMQMWIVVFCFRTQRCLGVIVFSANNRTLFNSNGPIRQLPLLRLTSNWYPPSLARASCRCNWNALTRFSKNNWIYSWCTASKRAKNVIEYVNRLINDSELHLKLQLMAIDAGCIRIVSCKFRHVRFTPTEKSNSKNWSTIFFVLWIGIVSIEYVAYIRIGYITTRA